MGHRSLLHARASLQRLSLSSSLSLYPLENEAILYSARSRCLFGLDHAATSLLLRLADGEPAATLTAGLDPAAAAAVRELANILADREPYGGGYCADKFCADTVPPNNHASPCYQLLTTCFTLECLDASLQKSILPPLGHLRAPDRAAIDLAVRIVPAGRLWQLHLNGTPQGDAVPANMLLPKLYDRLRIHAYQRLPYLLAVHAAVLADDYRTIVFPGKSGSGKSTLAATLLARGYRLFSDEVAILTTNEELLPIPLGLGLKSGSWQLLEKDYPTLATTAEHIRWNGSKVRYLEADVISFAREIDNGRATHLCFPAFQRHAQGSLVSLTPVTALRYLTEAGYQVRNLHEESVEQIVSWLLDLSCSMLTYSSPEEAVQLLDMALSSPSARYRQGYGPHAC